MGNVTGIKITADNIWAATDGGIFSYSFEDSSFLTLTKASGLEEISLASITSDNSGRIWTGSINGAINIYDVNANTFDVILDIFGSVYINKQINYLKSISDTMIVSTDYGVSIIDVNSYLFLDTYFKYGQFTTNTKVNFADKIGLFYICTDEGIAIQKEGATNLSAPESWDTYTTADGLLSNKTLKIVKFQGSILAATEKGISTFNGNMWQSFLPQFNNKKISDIIISGDSLVFSTGNLIYSYSNGISSQILSSPSSVKQLLFDPQVGVVSGASNGVYVFDSSTNYKLIIPNGPAANQFLNISVDNIGRLWSASGIDNTGKGVYSLFNNSWTNYNVANTPEIPNNDFYTTYTSPDNIAFLGIWGRGFVRTNGVSFEWYNADNSGMQGIPSDTNWLVITGFAADSKNNTWILNHAAADRRTLSMLTAGGEWHHFMIPAAQNRTLVKHYNLDIDPYDTKWLGSRDVDKRGLFYFNEMNTYNDNNDDRSGFITTTDGLNNDEVNTIVVDKRGDVWVGTSLGVNVISNTNTITSSSNPSLRISSVFTLRQQAINDIAVDPLNQKWVATNQGLLLVNSDGSRLITTLDSKNSPLLSDQIITVAIDQNAGIVYAATEKGLTSFETPFILPKESFDKLFVYPNPFEINGTGAQLTIDGLVRDTDLKVLSIDGKVVAEFSSPGGRVAFWDGRDNEGNFVSSGVYIIAAFDSEGSSLITGKVAVFHR
jgi:ligand-binding sensor domain-containing protein